MEKENIVFISYASEDKDRITPFYEHLKSRGFNVWIDHRELIGGQNWEFEIQRVFNKASIILLFISIHSCFKRGYIQREIQGALKNLEEKLPDDAYLVPVQLDEHIERPEHLKKLQFISANSPECIEQIERSITHQLTRFGEFSEHRHETDDITLTKLRLKEEWDGCPGYQFEGDKITITSNRHGSIREIADFINGDMLNSIFSAREVKFEQDFEWWNYGQATSLRTNTIDISLKDFYANESFASLRFLHLTYNAGAAHHNYCTYCYNFTLRPITKIQGIQNIFINPDDAFQKIQKTAREQIAKTLEKDTHDDMIVHGTENWNDFHTFFLDEKEIQFDFPPYQTASFAEGIQQVIISYESIKQLLKPTFASLFAPGLYS